MAEIGSDDGIVALAFHEGDGGKTVSGSKVRLNWRLSVDGQILEVQFTNTKTSGKKRVFVNGQLKHESTVYRSPNFNYSWAQGSHLMSIAPVQSGAPQSSIFSSMKSATVDKVDCTFELRINGLPFSNFARRPRPKQVARPSQQPNVMTRPATSPVVGAAPFRTSQPPPPRSPRRPDPFSAASTRTGASPEPERGPSGRRDGSSKKSPALLYQDLRKMGYTQQNGYDMATIVDACKKADGSIEKAVEILEAVGKSKPPPPDTSFPATFVDPGAYGSPASLRQERTENRIRHTRSLTPRSQRRYNRSPSPRKAPGSGTRKEEFRNLMESASSSSSDCQDNEDGSFGGFPDAAGKNSSMKRSQTTPFPNTSVSSDPWGTPSPWEQNDWHGSAFDPPTRTTSRPSVSKAAHLDPWALNASTEAMLQPKSPSTGSSSPVDPWGTTVPADPWGVQPKVFASPPSTPSTRNRKIVPTQLLPWEPTKPTSNATGFQNPDKLVGLGGGAPRQDNEEIGLLSGAAQMGGHSGLLDENEAFIAGASDMEIAEQMAILASLEASPKPTKEINDPWCQASIEPAKDVWAQASLESTKETADPWGEASIEASKDFSSPWAQASLESTKETADPWGEALLGSSKHVDDPWDKALLESSKHVDDPWDKALLESSNHVDDPWDKASLGFQPFEESTSPSSATESPAAPKEQLGFTPLDEEAGSPDPWAAAPASFSPWPEPAFQATVDPWAATTAPPQAELVVPCVDPWGASSTASGAAPPDPWGNGAHFPPAFDSVETTGSDAFGTKAASDPWGSDSLLHSSFTSVDTSNSDAFGTKAWPREEASRASQRKEEERFASQRRKAERAMAKIREEEKRQSQLRQQQEVEAEARRQDESRQSQLRHQHQVWGLSPGTKISVTGLTGAKHLNGLSGVCDRWDGASERWIVRLGNGEVKSLRPANCAVVTTSRPSTGKPSTVKTTAETELQDLFPQVDLPVIQQALAICHGDVQVAAEWLIVRLPQDEPSWPPPASPPQVARQEYAGGGRPARQEVRRRAVLIGINYFGTKAELRGCINDVWNMKRLLTEQFGWDANCMRILVDDNPNAMPTKANIANALRWLVQDVKPGDALFFHFSGHGAQQEDPNGYEEDGMNETICPVDFQRAGMLSDDEIGDIVVKSLPEGVRLTAIMDCCHSGTGLDLPFSWTGRAWKEETNPFHSAGDVQLFSGCEDEDCSADAVSSYGAAGGAMTTAFCDVLRSGSRTLSYPELMSQLDKLMRKRGFSQRPQLTSSQQFDVARPFQLDTAVPNSNATLGRIFRKKFPPRPKKILGPLAGMLGDAGLLVCGGLLAAAAAPMAMDMGARTVGMGAAMGGGMMTMGTDFLGGLF